MYGFKFPSVSWLEMSWHLVKKNTQFFLHKPSLKCPNTPPLASTNEADQSWTLLSVAETQNANISFWWLGWRISFKNMFPGECGAFLQKTSHCRFSSVFSAASGWKHLLSRCKQRWFKTAVFVGPALIHRLSLRMEACPIDQQWDRLYSRRLACQIADTQSGICTHTHTHTHILSPARGHIPNQVHTSMYTHIAVY